VSYKQGGAYFRIPLSFLGFILFDLFMIQLVICRAWLSSKAQAWARLDRAWAWKNLEPSPSQGLRLGLGWAWA